MQVIKMRDIVCIDLKLPVDLRMRCSRLAERLAKDGVLEDSLSGLNVIKCNDRLYALEKYAMVLAAKQVCPELSIDCNLIAVEKKMEIKELVVNELFLQSVSAINVSLLFELNRANNIGYRFRPPDLADILNVRRTALYKHRSKFQAIKERDSTPAKADISSSLSEIPPVDKDSANA